MTTKIRRAIVSVADMSSALAFYRDVLGLADAPMGPDVVALTMPGGVELLLHERQPTPGLAGIALTFTVDDVDTTTAAAVAVGCGVIDPPSDQPWGERQAVLTDPDGHVICLVTPVPRSAAPGSS